MLFEHGRVLFTVNSGRISSCEYLMDLIFLNEPEDFPQIYFDHSTQNLWDGYHSKQENGQSVGFEEVEEVDFNFLRSNEVADSTTMQLINSIANASSLQKNFISDFLGAVLTIERTFDDVTASNN